MHLQLDDVRSLVVSGFADPQTGDPELVSAQYDLSVQACCSLARTFFDGGYDVAIDDALELGAYERVWCPSLAGLEHGMIIVLPSLEVTLQRSRAREKRVREDITRRQHVACTSWSEALRLDTTGMSVSESLAQARARGLIP